MPSALRMVRPIALPTALPGWCAALVVVAAIALSASVAPAVAHDTAPSGSNGVKGMSEKRLRAWETTVLGPRHAAEHAAQRRSARQLRKALRNPRIAARYKRAQRKARLTARKSAAGPASEVGSWEPAFEIPVFGVNAAMLPTGKVMLYAYPAHPDVQAGNPSYPIHEAWAALWDPSKGTGSGAFRRVDPPRDYNLPTDHPGYGKPSNIWCSGTSFLADGQLLVTGGNLYYENADPGAYAFSGLKRVYTFDPWSETWTQQDDMRHGRWYPSQLLMPDGRTMIAQGLDEGGNGYKNHDIEIYEPAAQRGGVGKVVYAGQMPNTGVYDGELYPHMFWMPSGRGVITGPGTNDNFQFAPFALGAWPTVTRNFPALSRDRLWGNAVLVPGTPSGGSTSILQLGGSPIVAGAPQLATNTSERYDEALGGGYSAAPSQKAARSHANTVLLPDRSMVTVGGGVGDDASNQGIWKFQSSQKQVELWDPATGQWTLGAEQNEGRAYHSTALLLPDGRVLSAGDDHNGDPTKSAQHNLEHDTAEIYSPPYLFKGPRPVISRAPTAAGWNADVAVTAPGATSAVLVAPGAVTHGLDMNQRVVPLAMTAQSGDTTFFRTPPNKNIALPGMYMLFALSADGVPSIATWVQMRDGDVVYPPDPPVVTPPPGGETPPKPPVVTPPRSDVKGTTKTKRPTVSATIVRREGKRLVRVKIGKSTAARVKVKISLRDRRGRSVSSRTCVLRAGRSTVVASPKVTASVRSVRASYVSLAASRRSSGGRCPPRRPAGSAASGTHRRWLGLHRMPDQPAGRSISSTR